jgi:hypothetical protein
MSSEWLRWPGLSGARDGHLVVQRAAFGKADRARTDYRWLAASRGWDPTQERLERRLSLGGEDRGVRCPLWRHEGNQWLAVMCIPSRARDFEGRQTPLEKHMLRCAAVPGITPALAACALFDEVRNASSDRWFDSYGQPQWERPDYLLQLDESDAPALDIRLDDLVPRFEDGLAQLESATTAADLAQFYAQLLTPGLPPALLRLRSEMPLEPFSLAALLLPLDAKAYSLAGGIPSSIFPAEDDIQGWSGLVVQAHVQRVPARVPVSGEALRRGEELANALWARDPGRLVATPLASAAPAVARSQFAGPPAGSPNERPLLRQSDSAAVAAASPARRERSAKEQEAWERLFLRNAKEDFLHFVSAKGLMKEATDIPPDWRRSTANFALWKNEAERFKRDVLLRLEELEQRPTPGDWLLQARLDADRDIYRMKADIGRAWLIALAPREELLGVIGEPRASSEVGPLSFAVYFNLDNPQLWLECCDFDPKKIEDFVRRTRLGPTMTRVVDKWARDAGIT